MSLEDNDMNNCSGFFHECLHSAIAQNSFRKLNHLLNQPDVNFGCQNVSGETPIMSSLRMRLNDDFLMALINAGCEVNSRNKKQQSPLHLVAARPTVIVAQELIKRGANLNTQDENYETPLHYAVGQANLPLIHLLLYYGGSIHILNSHNVSPLRAALNLSIKDVFETLLKFSKCTSMITQRQVILRKAGFVELGSNSNFPPVYYALGHSDVWLFKQMWAILQPEVFLDNTIPFLLMYLRSCSFPTPQWLEVLNLILNSTVALQLIEDFRKCKNCKRWKYAFMSELLAALHRKEVEPTDRLSVLSLCIDMGVTVSITEVNSALHRYGLSPEVEMFIRAGDFCMTKNCLMEKLFPLTVFVLALDLPDKDCTLQLFQNQIRLTYDVNDFINSLGYFAMSSSMKTVLVELCGEYFGHDKKDEVEDALDDIPEVPSLLELSRNRVRKCIKDRVQKPYQFHDAVNKIYLPRKINEILRFKTPIY